jgi:NAD(P)-dependent dehydrogenase (short-subunit alcohol dehydrogenase family)
MRLIMQLEDKIALVTGAGRGMGRAISLQLAEAGCNVAVSDIDASTAEDTAVAVKQLGRESVVLPADMGDLQDIDRMFRQAKDAFGRLDVVVNNAGVTRYLDIMDVQEEDWDQSTE